MATQIFQRIVILLLVGVVCAMGYFIYNGGLNGGPVVDPGNGGSGILKTEKDFRLKLTELKMQRDKVERGISRLSKLKSKSLRKLRDLGIKTGADFRNSDNKDVKLEAVNLKEYSEQIGKIEKEVVYYDDAISGIRVMLDRIERERIGESVSLSEKDYLSLQKIIAQLDDNLKVELDLFEEAELVDLIDKEIED